MAEQPLLGKRLSPREKQTAKLIAQGKTNKEIAWTLGLTELTVKQYNQKIMRKLGMTNRTEVAVWAVRTMGMPPVV